MAGRREERKFRILSLTSKKLSSERRSAPLVRYHIKHSDIHRGKRDHDDPAAQGYWQQIRGVRAVGRNQIDPLVENQRKAAAEEQRRKIEQKRSPGEEDERDSTGGEEEYSGKEVNDVVAGDTEVGVRRH